jgi:hypothetical protein
VRPLNLRPPPQRVQRQHQMQAATNTPLPARSSQGDHGARAGKRTWAANVLPRPMRSPTSIAIRAKRWRLKKRPSAESSGVRAATPASPGCESGRRARSRRQNPECGVRDAERSGVRAGTPASTDCKSGFESVEVEASTNALQRLAMIDFIGCLTISSSAVSVASPLQRIVSQPPASAPGEPATARLRERATTRRRDRKRRGRLGRARQKESRPSRTL